MRRVVSWSRAHPWWRAFIVLALFVVLWIVWFGGLPFGEGHTE
ncbi:MAG TPA: hypothetical protein VNO56_02125 [Gaiellaceae bacterium]|nr:hypothetical protein [Gaiellaceae bacterium]